jgi:hypothetical protein
MELVSDVGRVESHFSLFGDSVSVSARQVHSLHRTYHRYGNSFGRTQVEARFGPFGDRATLDARLVHGLRQTYCGLKK